MSGLALGATTAVIGGAEFFKGLSDKKKDQSALNNLSKPFYQIQSEYYQNRNLAEQNASGGLPGATKQYETQEAQRGLGSSLDAILRSGGGINDASMLLGNYNNNIGKIGSEDAQMHLQNLQYFMKANSDLAGEKKTRWAINEYQPYEAKLKELKQSIATDQQNEMQGVSTAVGGVTAGITGSSNASLIKKLLSKSTPQDPYATGKGFAPANTYTPGLAPTGATPGASPGAGVNNINPNAFSGSGLVAPIDSSDND